MSRALMLFTSASLAALLAGCPAKPPAGAKSAPKAEKAPAHSADEHAHQEKAASSQPATKLGKGESPADRDQTDPDGVTRRGHKLSDAKALTVAQAYAQSKALAGKPVKVSGVVRSVCKVKGCWFVIADDDKSEQSIRIGSKGYKFFMPRSSAGKKVVLEGDLEIKEVSVAEAQHLEDDRVRGTDEKPKKITAPKQELRIAAVAVEMRS